LIDYLVRNGNEQVIRDCRNHLIEIQTLTEFQHIEEDKDVGLSGEYTDIFSTSFTHFLSFSFFLFGVEYFNIPTLGIFFVAIHPFS
jgi:hypothetical protein